jgi:hypothetical protein
MPRKLIENEYYEEVDIEYENHKKAPRRFKKDDKEIEKKKKWERESFFDRDHDYFERK